MQKTFISFFLLISMLASAGLARAATTVEYTLSGYAWGADSGTYVPWNGTSFLAAPYSSADVNGNVSGIGWISMNCSDPNVCSTSNYAVTIDPTTGELSGDAWSSNLGWINFDAGCPNSSGATIGTNNYPNVCGAQLVDPINGPTGTNFTEMVGWARACSVFASGCSGALLPSLDTGGWDGWISMSGYNTQASNPSYRVWLDTDTNLLNGFAWGGGDVIGWIDFTGVVVPPINQPNGATTGGDTSTGTTGSTTNTTGSSGGGTSAGSNTSTGTGTTGTTGTSGGTDSGTDTSTTGTGTDGGTVNNNNSGTSTGTSGGSIPIYIES